MKWPIFTVSYWNHPLGINDCWGNRIEQEVKARTISEAINKAELNNFPNHFRLRSVECPAFNGEKITVDKKFMEKVENLRGLLIKI